ncbi:hypothetical protein ACFO4E_09710 [Nocardiopsis mangrovi]|uniref:Uncharacterized protein n=1 Tax=Nocardiopsis mangrovi TaxID=1179818 RepID=A0ABV9DVG7_9ACTN
MKGFAWRRLADPWWLLAGAIAGGLSWAIGLPPPASIGIGLIIWLTAIVVVGYVFGDLRSGAAPAAGTAGAPTAAVPENGPVEGNAGGAGASAAPSAANVYSTRARAACAAFEVTAEGLRGGPAGALAERMLWRFRDTVDAVVWLEENTLLLAGYRDELGALPGQAARHRRVASLVGEAERRTAAGTEDLEDITPVFAGLTGAMGDGAADSELDTLGGLARRLEGVGYGVAIAEQMVAEALGIGAPPEHFRSA